MEYVVVNATGPYERHVASKAGEPSADPLLAGVLRSKGFAPGQRLRCPGARGADAGLR